MNTKPLAAIGVAAALALSGAAYGHVGMKNGVNLANKGTTTQASPANAQNLSKKDQSFLKEARRCVGPNRHKWACKRGS
jgi:hypothetical protein